MPHRILLVEDEAILALAEARTIQKYGYEVVTAYTGREAIDLVESDPDISLILMDIDLGRGMDGTETAQRILETHDLPIAFLSSHTEPAIVEKTEGITSYGYIVKNSGETVLIASIKMAFRLYEAHMALKAQKENLRTALVQQEQAEEELLAKTEELDRYFTSSLDMLCIADTNGRLIRLNPEWETVLGYPVSELEGRSFMDLVHPDDVEATLKAVERLRQQEEVLSFENRYRCRDGSYRWIEWRSRPMGNAIYAAARDITDRRKMEDDLRSSEEKFRSLMDQSADQLYLHDLGGNIIEVNEAAVNRTGYKREELLSMKVSDLDPDYVDREDRGLFWEQLGLHQPFRFEGRHRNKDGNIYQVEVVLTKIRIENGIYIMALSRDISERKTEEEHLKSRMQYLSTSAARYRSLFYESPLGAIEFDTEGVITECNDSFISISGSSRERLIGFNLLTELQDRELLAQVRKTLDEGAGFYEGNYTSVTGNKQSYLRIFFKGIRDEGGVISSCLCLVEDISEQKKAENELREKTELLRKITDNMFDMIAVTDMQGNFTFLGRSHEVLGYDLAFLLGRNVLDFVHPEDLQGIQAAFQEFVENQEDTRTVQYRYRCDDGSYIWLETVGNIITDEQGRAKEILFSSRDITGRISNEKALKESEKRYRNLFNNSAIALWEEDITAVQSEIASLKRKGVSDFDTFFTENPDVMKDLISRIEIIDVNDAAVGMHKAKSKESLLGQLDKTLYPTDITLHLMKKELIAIAQRDPYVEGEIQAKNLEGQLLDLMVRINLLYQDDQSATMLVAISDITMLKNALKEKDELMQELNHRVKNNLAMVSSLIRLKDSELGDTADLSDINHQIEAIRLIHEKLYQKEEIARISVGEYIEDLIQSVFNSFTVRVIELESRIEDISLNSKTALSLGLIINEMATNAIKHGFNEKEDPRFTVEMKKDTGSNCYVLTVSNTGNPFPGEIDLEAPETLGLQIIATLIEQLDGTLDLEKRPHPVFTITFPIEESQ